MSRKGDEEPLALAWAFASSESMSVAETGTAPLVLPSLESEASVAFWRWRYWRRLYKTNPVARRPAAITPIRAKPIIRPTDDPLLSLPSGGASVNAPTFPPSISRSASSVNAGSSTPSEALRRFVLAFSLIYAIILSSSATAVRMAASTSS